MASCYYITTGLIFPRVTPTLPGAKEKDPKRKKEEGDAPAKTSKKQKLNNEDDALEAKKNASLQCKHAIIDGTITFEINEPFVMTGTFDEAGKVFKIAANENKKIPPKTVLAILKEGRLQAGNPPGKGWLGWAFSKPESDTIMMRDSEHTTTFATVADAIKDLKSIKHLGDASGKKVFVPAAPLYFVTTDETEKSFLKMLFASSTKDLRLGKITESFAQARASLSRFDCWFHVPGKRDTPSAGLAHEGLHTNLVSFDYLFNNGKRYGA